MVLLRVLFGRQCGGGGHQEELVHAVATVLESVVMCSCVTNSLCCGYGTTTCKSKRNVRNQKISFLFS